MVEELPLSMPHVLVLRALVTGALLEVLDHVLELLMLGIWLGYEGARMDLLVVIGLGTRLVRVYDGGAVFEHVLMG